MELININCYLLLIISLDLSLSVQLLDRARRLRPVFRLNSQHPPPSFNVLFEKIASFYDHFSIKLYIFFNISEKYIINLAFCIVLVLNVESYDDFFKISICSCTVLVHKYLEFMKKIVYLDV